VSKFVIPTTILIALLVIALGIILSPDLRSRLIGSTSLVDTEVIQKESIAAPPGSTTLAPDNGQFTNGPEVTADQKGHELTTWTGLQVYADLTFDQWYTHGFQPEDTNSGYFDGVIGGGLDVATRFRLNSVSVFLADLGEQGGCQFYLVAGPVQGGDTQSYGMISIDITTTDERCEAPQDLVGLRLETRASDEHRIEVSSHSYLDSDNRERWGTLWTNSEETELPFQVFITGIEEGYLIGAVDGFLRLNSYAGQDMNSHDRGGRLFGIFRARL